MFEESEHCKWLQSIFIGDWLVDSSLVQYARVANDLTAPSTTCPPPIETPPFPTDPLSFFPIPRFIIDDLRNHVGWIRGMPVPVHKRLEMNTMNWGGEVGKYSYPAGETQNTAGLDITPLAWA